GEPGRAVPWQVGRRVWELFGDAIEPRTELLWGDAQTGYAQATYHAWKLTAGRSTLPQAVPGDPAYQEARTQQLAHAERQFMATGGRWRTQHPQIRIPDDVLEELRNDVEAEFADVFAELFAGHATEERWEAANREWRNRVPRFTADIGATL